MSTHKFVCLKGFWLGNHKFRKGDPFNTRLVTETQCQDLEKEGKIAKATADYAGPLPERRPTTMFPPETQEALNEPNEPTATRVSAARDPKVRHTSEDVNGSPDDPHSENDLPPDDGPPPEVVKAAAAKEEPKKAEEAKPAAPARTPAIQRQDAAPARRPNRPGSPKSDK